MTIQPCNADDVIECADGEQMFRREYEDYTRADLAVHRETRVIPVGHGDYEHTVRSMLERREAYRKAEAARGQERLAKWDGEE